MFVSVTNMKFFSARNTAYIFHGLTIIYGICFAIYYFAGIDSALDINTHDTYYVIWEGHVLLLFSILNIFISIIYTFVKPKIKLLNFIHAFSGVLLPFIFFKFLMIFEVEAISFFYIIASLLFLINVTYTLITYLIKPK